MKTDMPLIVSHLFVVFEEYILNKFGDVSKISRSLGFAIMKWRFWLLEAVATGSRATQHHRTSNEEIRRP